MKISIKRRAVYYGSQKTHIVWVESDERKVAAFSGTEIECIDFINDLEMYLQNNAILVQL